MTLTPDHHFREVALRMPLDDPSLIVLTAYLAHMGDVDGFMPPRLSAPRIAMGLGLATKEAPEEAYLVLALKVRGWMERLRVMGLVSWPPFRVHHDQIAKFADWPSRLITPKELNDD
jgi:hypothetical protein